MKRDATAMLRHLEPMKTTDKNKRRHPDSNRKRKQSSAPSRALQAREVGGLRVRARSLRATARSDRSKRSKLRIESSGLTVREAARVLSVSRSRVYRLCRGPQLSAQVFPEGLRIRPADLAAYLKGAA